jgi:tetratricopeptide (TPR) repeat protein
MERAGSEEDVAVMAAQLGRFMVFTGEFEAAMPHLERALTLAETHGLHETFAQALNSKAVLMGRTHRPREAKVLIEGALAVALEHELHRAALRAYNNKIAGLWVNDEWAAEMETLEQALALARRIGDRQWEASFTAGSVGGLIRLGRWDEALAFAAQGREIATTEFARGLMIGVIEIHLWRGDVERAREILMQNADIGRSENADFSGGWSAEEARVLAAEGKLVEALASARRAVSYHDHGPPSWILFTLLEIADWTSDDAIVREVLALLGTAAATEVTRGVRAQAARLRARLPEHDTDAELATAERLFRELDAQFHLALVQAQRDPSSAEAQETFERLGVRQVSDTSKVSDTVSAA